MGGASYVFPSRPHPSGEKSTMDTQLEDKIVVCLLATIDTIGHAQGIGNDHSNTLIFKCTLRVRF